MTDTLNKEQILAWMEDKTVPLEVFAEVDSTNTRAKELLKEGQKGPFLLIANQQNAGRGRRGHSFFSPAEGLYYTLVIHPEDEMNAIARTTIAAAVSVQEAVEEACGTKLSIKWVNDLYLNRKKVTGILCEAPRDMENNLAGIVIGIGINVKEQNFPDELKEIAGAINNDHLNRSELAGRLTNRLLYWCERLNDPSLIDAYRSHSFLIGKPVSFIQNEEEIHGIAVDVNDDGNLVVKNDRGTYVLSSGEVSLKSW